VDTAHAITNAEEVFKKDSDIVIIPPPPMVVLVVLVTLKWCELVTHINAQV